MKHSIKQLRKTIKPTVEDIFPSVVEQSNNETMALETSNDAPELEVIIHDLPADAPADVPAAPAIASSRKLSNEKALDILQRLDAGVKGSVLAKEYNVDSSTISDIKVGRLYKTVLADYKKSKETAEITQP